MAQGTRSDLMAMAALILTDEGPLSSIVHPGEELTFGHVFTIPCTGPHAARSQPSQHTATPDSTKS